MRYLFPLLLVFFFVFIDDCSSYRLHEVKYSKLIRVRRDDVKILKTGHLPDGTKFERIQESGIDLPPLPIEEEVDDLSDSRIGQLDDQGEVLIPVDEHGNPIPGYEYILKPIVIEINSEKHAHILKELESVHTLPSSNTDLNPKVFNPSSGNVPRYEQPSDRIEEQAGDDYAEDNGEDKSGQADIPNLPPVDYKDSGETDDNLKPISDEKKETDEEVEIEIPSNKISDPIPVDINYSEEEKNRQNQENVLKPDRGELGEPIPFQPQTEEVGEKEKEAEAEEKYEKESEKVVDDELPVVDSLDNLTEEDIEELAKDFQKELSDKIMSNVQGNFGESEDELIPKENTAYEPYPVVKQAAIGDGQETVSAGTGNQESEGFILDDSDVTDEERANILRASEGKATEIPKTVEDKNEKVVRGGRIGPKPSSAYSSNHFIIPVISFLLFSVL